ncbi:MAG: hypothetical protein MHMPM18_001898, partial [Marteilia pararefringens]
HYFLALKYCAKAEQCDLDNFFEKIMKLINESSEASFYVGVNNQLIDSILVSTSTSNDPLIEQLELRSNDDFEQKKIIQLTNRQSNYSMILIKDKSLQFSSQRMQEIFDKLPLGSTIKVGGSTKSKIFQIINPDLRRDILEINFQFIVYFIGRKLKNLFSRCQILEIRIIDNSLQEFSVGVAAIGSQTPYRYSNANNSLKFKNKLQLVKLDIFWKRIDPSCTSSSYLPYEISLVMSLLQLFLILPVTINNRKSSEKSIMFQILLASEIFTASIAINFLEYNSDPTQKFMIFISSHLYSFSILILIKVAEFRINADWKFQIFLSLIISLLCLTKIVIFSGILATLSTLKDPIVQQQQQQSFTISMIMFRILVTFILSKCLDNCRQFVQFLMKGEINDDKITYNIIETRCSKFHGFQLQILLLSSIAICLILIPLLFSYPHSMIQQLEVEMAMHNGLINDRQRHQSRFESNYNINSPQLHLIGEYGNNYSVITTILKCYNSVLIRQNRGHQMSDQIEYPIAIFTTLLPIIAILQIFLIVNSSHLPSDGIMRQNVWRLLARLSIILMALIYDFLNLPPVAMIKLVTTNIFLDAFEFYEFMS